MELWGWNVFGNLVAGDRLVSYVHSSMELAVTLCTHWTELVF